VQMIKIINAPLLRRLHMPNHKQAIMKIEMRTPR